MPDPSRKRRANSRPRYSLKLIGFRAAGYRCSRVPAARFTLAPSVQLDMARPDKSLQPIPLRGTAEFRR